MAHWSIIAIAGPRREIADTKKALEDTFDEVHIFEVSDDYGEFPDTSGYTAENWEEMQTEIEDGNLFPIMTKCMDCALDYTNKKERAADMLGCYDIKKSVHWPKFGGKIFAVTGHVTTGGMPFASEQ